MDIMFIVSPSNASSMYMPFYYLYLAGYLEKHGFTVSICDPHFRAHEDNVNYILDQVKIQKPKHIGMAVFVTDYNVIYSLAKQIKKITDVPLLVGNAQPSIAPEDFLYEESPFDIVCRGEAEITVKEILETSRDKIKRDKNRVSGLEIISSSDGEHPLAHIDGINYFDGESIVATKNRQLINLIDMGKPAYHLLDMDWFLQPSKYMIRRLATVCVAIYTGRGCPFDCNFCASNVVWHTNDRVPGNSYTRNKPLSATMEELELLQNKYGFDFFYILDDTFGLTDKTIVNFCNEYQKSGLKMLWGAETRAPCIDNPETLQLMKNSGCIQLDFGVESGSPKILKLVKKKVKLEQIHTAFELCHRVGMRSFANLLLNMPEETEEDLEMTHKLLNRIKPTYTSIGLTQPYPGTPIYENLGQKIDKTEYYLLNRDHPPEKFRLCKHKLDLPKLLFSWRKKYGQFPLFERSMIVVGWPYWKTLLFSKHRMKYFQYLLKDFTITFVTGILRRTPIRDLWVEYRKKRDAKIFGAQSQGRKKAAVVSE